MGNRGAHRRENDTRGLWTPDKLKQARGSFASWMVTTAARLQVPPMELARYALHGEIPPMGEEQRVAGLLEDRSRQEAIAKTLQLVGPGED